MFEVEEIIALVSVVSLLLFVLRKGRNAIVNSLLLLSGVSPGLARQASASDRSVLAFTGFATLVPVSLATYGSFIAALSFDASQQAAIVVGGAVGFLVLVIELALNGSLHPSATAKQKKKSFIARLPFSVCLSIVLSVPHLVHIMGGTITATAIQDAELLIQEAMVPIDARIAEVDALLVAPDALVLAKEQECLDMKERFLDEIDGKNGERGVGELAEEKRPLMNQCDAELKEARNREKTRHATLQQEKEAKLAEKESVRADIEARIPEDFVSRFTILFRLMSENYAVLFYGVALFLAFFFGDLFALGMKASISVPTFVALVDQERQKADIQAQAVNGAQEALIEEALKTILHDEQARASCSRFETSLEYTAKRGEAVKDFKANVQNIIRDLGYDELDENALETIRSLFGYFSLLSELEDILTGRRETPSGSQSGDGFSHGEPSFDA